MAPVAVLAQYCFCVYCIAASRSDRFWCYWACMVLGRGELLDVKCQAYHTTLLVVAYADLLLLAAAAAAVSVAFTCV